MADSSSLIERISHLPSPSPVLQRIRSIMANPESSATDIVRALKLDPVVAGKVLKLANSAYIGIPRTVSSMQNAVVLLGQKRVYSLVMGVSVLSTMKVNIIPPFFSLNSFWRHSITVALVAESIAKHLNRYDSIDSDEVFTAGILHDIGKLILCGYDPERIETAITESEKSNKPFYTAEDPEMSHMKIGVALANHWNFPDDLTQAIKFHNRPSDCEEIQLLLAIIHVANCIAHIAGFQTFYKEAVPEFSDDAVSAIRLSPERLRVITDEAMRSERKIESLLDFMT